MFLPLRDEVPLRRIRRPLVNWAVILLNGLVWLAIGATASAATMQAAAIGFGVIPSVLFGVDHVAGELLSAPAWATPVTSLFLHAGFFHMAGNMAFLWVFGDNVEDAFGSARYLAFYLACGVCAALLHAWSAPDSQQPLIGASGAVSGVVAAYLLLHPRVRVWGLFLNRVPLRVRAFWGIGFWIIFQIGMGVFGGASEVAWWAHVGGLMAGAALTPLLIQPGVAMFGRDDAL